MPKIFKLIRRNGTSRQGKRKKLRLTETMEHPESKSKAWAPIAAIVLIIFMFLSGLFAPKGWNWALVMIFMIVFITAIGKLITGRFSGVFINEHYIMSLSRFQLVIWTLIVLSAFLTIALERINAGVPDPLAIALPTQLWALLGISTTSLVGSPVILSTKLSKTPTKAVKDKAALLFAKTLSARDIEAAEQADSTKFKELKTIADKKKATADGIIEKGIERSGIRNFNVKFKDAEFSNMFTGDELANKGLIDIAKVQMFFFTIVIAFSYMVLLVNLIMTAEPAGLNGFPELSDGVVALLGISSAGYLTNKAPDKTKTKTD